MRKRLQMQNTDKNRTYATNAAMLRKSAYCNKRKPELEKAYGAEIFVTSIRLIYSLFS